MVRAHSVHSFYIFQEYNKSSLTVITLPCNRFPEIYFSYLAVIMFPLIQYLPSHSQCPGPDNHHPLTIAMRSTTLDPVMERNYDVIFIFCCAWLIPCSIAHFRFTEYVPIFLTDSNPCTVRLNSLPFYIHILLYRPFIRWWSLCLFLSYLCHCE